MTLWQVAAARNRAPRLPVPRRDGLVQCRVVEPGQPFRFGHVGSENQPPDHFSAATGTSFDTPRANASSAALVSPETSVANLLKRSRAHVGMIRSGTDQQGIGRGHLFDQDVGRPGRNRSVRGERYNAEKGLRAPRPPRRRIRQPAEVRPARSNPQRLGRPPDGRTPPALTSFF